MDTSPKYYIVESEALPEVFVKVAQAKQLLATGQVDTVNDAVCRVGISRSAFYKYRDSVFPFQDMLTGRIVTFQLLLHDAPGMLSGILGAFAESGANILTINQTIPSGGCAAVTVTAQTMHMTVSVEELLGNLRLSAGVVKAEVLAG